MRENGEVDSKGWRWGGPRRVVEHGANLTRVKENQVETTQFIVRIPGRFGKSIREHWSQSQPQDVLCLPGTSLL